MTNLYIGSRFSSLIRRSFHCFCICLCNLFFFSGTSGVRGQMTLFPVWCITSVLPAGRSVWTWNTKDGISLPYCISCLHCYCSLLENCSIPRQRTWKRSDTPDTSSMLTATWRKVAGTDGMTSEGSSTVLGADARRTHLPRLMTPRGIPVGVLKAGSSFSPSSNTLSLNNWREKNTKVLKYSTKLYLIIQYLTYCIYTTATVILYLKCNKL